MASSMLKPNRCWTTFKDSWIGRPQSRNGRSLWNCYDLVTVVDRKHTLRVKNGTEVSVSWSNSLIRRCGNCWRLWRRNKPETTLSQNNIWLASQCYKVTKSIGTLLHALRPSNQIKSNQIKFICHKFCTQYNNNHKFALSLAEQTGDNFALYLPITTKPKNQNKKKK